MPDVASLSVVVSADTSAAESSLNSFGSKLGSVGSAIQGALGGAAIAAVAGVGAAFVGSVKSAADFEKQMSAISAVTGATSTDMEGLTKTALQLGKDTSYSASEAAAGMEELAKAGVSVQDIMGGAGRAALDLAAAGAVSVADAAEIASNAMNVFNIEGANMGHVADVIAGAANASAISVTDYKFSLSAAGAVASTVGIGFESLSEAIAVMGQAGIKGSDAGTSLKTMMMNLIPSTNAQRDLFRDLGLQTQNLEQGYQNLVARGIQPANKEWSGISDAIKQHLGLSQDISTWSKKDVEAFEKLAMGVGVTSNAFFDASGKAKSMSEIAQVLQDSMGGMTKQAQLAALEIMFGSDAIRAGSVLLEAGSAGFDKMAESMGKVTAQAVAEERLNNLWGSVEKLKGSLETAAIMLGGLITPTLKTWADAATGAVNEAIVVLEQIPDVVRTIQQVFGEGWEPAENIHPVTNAVGELAVAFRDTLWPAIQQVVGFVTGTLVPAFQAVGEFLAEHPGLIAAVAAGWATFVIITTVVGWITGAIAAFTALSGAITAAGGVIALIVGVLGGPLTLAILAVAAVVAVLVLAWTENWFGIQEITASAVAFLTTAFTDLMAFLQTTWTAIVEATTTAWTAVSEAFTTGATTVQGLWQAGWNAIATILTAAWNLLSTENQTRITELIRLMTELWTTLGQAWTTGTTALTTLLTTWWTTTTTDWQAYQTAVAETVGPWWTTIKGYWDTALTAIKDALTAAWAWIKEQTGTFFTDLGAAFTGAASTLGTKATELGAAIMEALKTAINAKVTEIVESVTGAVSKALAAARSLIGQSGGGTAVGASAPQSDKIARAKQLAVEQGLDPELFAAQLMQESGFNVGAVSGAGARGIGQFMPGTGAAYAAKLGVSYEQMVNDADLSMRAAAMHMADLTKSLGSQERALSGYYAGPGGGVHPEYVSAVRGQLSKVAGVPVPPPGVAAAQRAMIPQIGQMGLVGGTLTYAEAQAFCGPAAAMWFANIYGRMPNTAEAEAMARSVGWSEEWGMQGPASQLALLQKMGVGAQMAGTSPAEIGRLAAANVPFMISTGGGGTAGSGHYYQVQGGDLGGLNVGASGEAYAGGKPVMSLAEIVALSGAINGVITLAPQMGAAVAAATTQAGTGFVALTGQTITWADGTTAAFTEVGGQMTMTLTNAAGQVVSTFTGMETAVVAEASLMAQTVGTTVTTMGNEIMTKTMDASGNMITTIATTSGVVTAQYTELASGVTLTMGDMNAGILTSTTDLGGAIMTTVQDTAGNYITTITDMSGQVTSQYVSLAGAAVEQTAAMNESVTSEIASMSETAVSTVTDMGGAIMSTSQDAAGNLVTTITDMAGNVTATYTSMASTTISAAQKMAESTVSAIEDGVSGIEEAVGEIESVIGDALSEAADTAADQAGEIGQSISEGIANGISDGAGEVADAVRDVVEEAVDEARDEAESESPSKRFAREVGLPIAQGVAAGIDAGAGLVADSTRALIGVPEAALPSYTGAAGSGGTDTIILKIDIGGRVAEEIVVEGRELAVRRGRIPAGAF